MLLTAKGNQSRLSLPLQYFFLLFFTFLFFPPGFYNAPVHGLDESWNIALHLAHQYNLVFGKDFDFTYGPLGILISRKTVAVNKFVYLLFDLYFVTTSFFVIRKIFKEHFNAGTVIFLYLCIAMIGMQQLEIWYFIFYLFYLLSFLKEPNQPIYIAQAALLSLIGFYMKINLGVTAILIFLLALHYFLIRGKVKVKGYVIILIAYIGSIFISAAFLRVDLKGYLLSCLQFIDGYNDAMGRPASNAFVVYIYAACLIFLILLYRFVPRLLELYRGKGLWKNADELFTYAVVALSAFIVFKSGFVRSDTHMAVFFKAISPVIALLFLFSIHPEGKRISAAIAWITLSIAFLCVNTMPEVGRIYKGILNFSFLGDRFQQAELYFRQVGNYDHDQAAYKEAISGNNELRSIIGDSSVDIIPSEIADIYLNGLHYNPRPVIQSYAAFTGYLDSLNYEKYSSPQAPAYVLFSVNTIDDRFPFFDETRTKLALLERYEYIGKAGDNLILRKKPVSAPVLQSGREEVIHVKMGDEIPVQRTPGIQFTRLFIRYNTLGKLRRLFYQPPILKITFTLEDGQTRAFRAIKPILEDGVILNKYVDDNNEFQVLLQSGGLLNTNVRSVRIGPDDPPSFCFDSAITMITRYCPVVKKTGPEHLADSLGIAGMIRDYGVYRPLLMDSAHYVQDKFFTYINTLKTHSRFINIDGWAFHGSAGNKDYLVKLDLWSADRMYELPTQDSSRIDLGMYFHRDDLLHAFFIARADKSLLASGDYKLVVAISDPANHKTWYKITDKHLLIRSAYKIEKIKGPVQESADKDSLRVFIDNIEDIDSSFIADGWAFSGGADPVGTMTNLILANDTAAYRISTDVTASDKLIGAFVNPSLGYSGFSVFFPDNRLPGGNYRVGIEKIYANGKGRMMRFTGRTIGLGIPATPRQPR
jgi:hypothetical protein